MSEARILATVLLCKGFLDEKALRRRFVLQLSLG